MSSTLVKIDIFRGTNDAGLMSWLVTPYYRLADGRVISVPDAWGWSNRAEAVAEAKRIAGAKLAE